MGGTAPGSRSALVQELSPNNGTKFDIAVSGMDDMGTVSAWVEAQKVTDLAGNGNAAVSKAV